MLDRKIGATQGWLFATAKSILPGQWKKPVKTTVKTGKNWQ